MQSLLTQNLPQYDKAYVKDTRSVNMQPTKYEKKHFGVMVVCMADEN